MRTGEIKNLIKGAETLLSSAQNEKDPFLRDTLIKASIAFSWFGLEGFTNLALSDFLSLKGLRLHERAFIEEQKIEFVEGEFLIKGRKYNSTRDKLTFLLMRFGQYNFKASDSLWNRLNTLENWRHTLIHPKEQSSNQLLSKRHAVLALETAKGIISLVYTKVYKKTARF